MLTDTLKRCPELEDGMKYEVEFTVKELSLSEITSMDKPPRTCINLIGKKFTSDEAPYGSLLLYGLDTDNAPKLGSILKVTVETE